LFEGLGLKISRPSTPPAGFIVMCGVQIKVRVKIIPHFSINSSKVKITTIGDVEMEKAVNKKAMLEKLNRETAKINWSELARFFAAGSTLYVSPAQDLLEVACTVAEDKHELFGQLLETGNVSRVTDEQARRWLEQDAVVWASVILPWVLVQEVEQVQI